MRHGRMRFVSLLLAVFLAADVALAADPSDGASLPPSDWAAGEVERAFSLGLITEEMQGAYQREMTRREFAELAVRFLGAQYDFYGAYGSDDLPVFLPIFLDSSKGQKAAVYSKEQLAELLPAEFPELHAPGSTVSWDTLLHHIAPFSDVAAGTGLYLNTAFVLGIVNGRGDGTFGPEDPITRQEAAAMLARVYKIYAEADSTMVLDDPYLSLAFSDPDDISPWARPAVALLARAQVMEGIGEKRFAPNDFCTREQCFCTFVRLFQNMPVSRAKGNVAPFASLEEDILATHGGFFVSSATLYENDAVLLTSAHYGGLPHGDPYDRFYIFYKTGGMRAVSVPRSVDPKALRISVVDSDTLSLDTSADKYQLDLLSGELVRQE